MSDNDKTSGTNTPAISLPKGGGAIKGIGETFQPNLFTGTGNFSVPIYTSSSRNDFGPKLSLQYSTGNGNGPFGLGWQLSIPRITRKTEKGLPQYNNNDVFVLSGAEDLVPMDQQPDWTPPDGYHITYFRPRTEGLFARIAKWVGTRDGKPDVHWRVTTKENVTSIYGKTSGARLVHPEDSSKVFEWLLEETFDAKGNHILYEYLQENPTPNINELYEHNRVYTQVYLRRILYGNTPDHDELTEEDKAGPVRSTTHHDGMKPTESKDRHYLFEVLFDYGDIQQEPNPGFNWRTLDDETIPNTWSEDPLQDQTLRKDPFSSFRASFEIRTLRRCKRVLMLHHFNEGELTNAPLVKATEFAYDINPDTKLLFLTGATLHGYRKDPQDSNRYMSRDMPPVSFKYSTFEPQKQKYQSLNAQGGDLPPVSLADPNTTLMDVFGNALPDIVQTTTGRFDHWENHGNGNLGRRRPLTKHSPPIALSQPGVSVGDLDGDGLVDLIVEDPLMSGSYEAKPDGTWQTFKRSIFPSIGLGDPNVRLLDLTGDGLSDILVTRDQYFLWYQSKGEQGFEQAQAITRKHDLDEFPDVYFSDPAGRVRLADMSGDGLNDIVLVHDGRIDYWPNIGYGKFGKRLTMKATPHIGHGYDRKRIFLADLDGTGCADLVYVENHRIRFWFNRSGNEWSGAQVINGTPDVSDLTRIQFADIFGTGTATLVWSYDYGQHPGENYKALNFCGEVKPNLLIEMDNHMGATTRVKYASSTKYYLQDKKAGQPWVTHLPFPVQVLEKTETIDHVSNTKLVTQYEYHHGYYDGKEREFRGFGRVDQIDTEFFTDFAKKSLHEKGITVSNAIKSIHVPPVLTKNWFHTGIYFDKNYSSANGVFYDGQDMMAAYEHEFYSEDVNAFKLEKHSMPVDVTPHEAYRTLRGSLLHSEVYALDGSNKQKHPYVVNDNRYQVKRLQAKNDYAHAVYFSTQRESLSYHYERAPDDPRITHQLTIEVDEYNNITKSVSIAYPRRRPASLLSNPRNSATANHDSYPEQRSCKATYSKNQFINKDNKNHYRYLGIPYETQVFEVHGLDWQWPEHHQELSSSAGVPLLAIHKPPFDPSDFLDMTNNDDYEPFENDPPSDPATFKKRLVDWKRNYFHNETQVENPDPPDQHTLRLQLGEINPLGLPYESYQVAFNDSLLNKIYADKQATIQPELKTNCGYVKINNYWWIPSGKQGVNPNQFYLPTISQNQFGARSEVQYDHYALLINKARDALPTPQSNIIQANNDYRDLQPYELTDPNGNRSQVRFDTLGMVAGTAVMGKSSEHQGDSFDDFIADLSNEQINTYITSDNPRELATQYLGTATSRIIYDLHQEPPVASTIARVTHESDLDHTQNEHSEVQLSFAYSDGFGREYQSKAQAEPEPNPDTPTLPRWIGTGTKVYNNKGKPVQEYEPFFSDSHAPGIEQHGVSPTLFYDPLERVICTIHPNGSYEKVVFDPWQQTTYDSNDTVLMHPGDDIDVKGYVKEFIDNYKHPITEQPFATWYDQRIPDRTHKPQPNADDTTPEQRAALKTEKHANTPTKIFLDTLARPFLTVQDNGPAAEQKLKTRVKLDIEGNDTMITDPRGVECFKHKYDIAGRKLYINSVDAGEKWLLLTVDNQPLISWDANGNVFSQTYDRLRRPISTQVQRPEPHNDQILSQVSIYGEALASETQPERPNQTNHRGQLYALVDSSGWNVNRQFDFKGNLTASKQLLAKQYEDVPDWSAIDFDQAPEDIEQDLLVELENEVFYVTNNYDALNRIIKTIAPDHSKVTPADAIPENGSIYLPVYNEANLLNSMQVDIRAERERQTRQPGEVFRPFVNNIDYNARGQRDRIEYGNKVITYYTYDPNTYRLMKIETKRKNGTKIQDLNYTYDPVGNITEISDHAIKIIYHDQQEILPRAEYDYDPVYQLISASGREHKSMSAAHYRKSSAFKQSEYQPFPPSSDTRALQMYHESYRYDPSGNLTELTHRRGMTTDGQLIWRRKQNYQVEPDTNNPISNRITRSGADADQPERGDVYFNIHHDANGNITNMGHMTELNWDFNNRLVNAKLNASDDRVYYQYDQTGQRIRKVVIKNHTREERIYLNGFEIYRKTVASQLDLERHSLHIMDNKERVSLAEYQTNAQSSEEAAIGYRYLVSNHLGSSVTEVDDTQEAIPISYEEYYPYGGTSFVGGKDQNVVKQKLYRYSGKERDDETGLYYYGARYYAPWLGRWLTSDPAGIVDGNNLFSFTRNSPIQRLDYGGRQSKSSVLSDVWSGIKAIPTALLEPLYIVEDLVFMGITMSVGEKVDINTVAPYMSSTSQRLIILESTNADLLDKQAVALLPAASIITGGGAAVIDNVLRVYEERMSPEEAQSFLTQAAATQVGVTGIAIGISKGTGNGWTGRPPSATPQQLQAAQEALTQSRAALQSKAVSGKSGRAAKDALRPTGKATLGKPLDIRGPVIESLEGRNPSGHVEMLNFRAGSRVMIQDQSTCSSCRSTFQQGGMLDSVRTYTLRNPAKPKMSPKSAARKAASGKGEVEVVNDYMVGIKPPLGAISILDSMESEPLISIDPTLPTPIEIDLQQSIPEPYRYQ